jgi:multidrug efflux system membrane fusion protein
MLLWLTVEPSSPGRVRLPAWESSFALFLGALLALGGCAEKSSASTTAAAIATPGSAPGSAPGSSAAAAAVPVITAKAVAKSVPVVVPAIGNVEACSTVQVKPQIEGQLLRVHFREGQDVKKGDLLFEIDPRPFEAVLKRAEAGVTQDMARLENARAEAERVAKLHESGLSSNNDYDIARTGAQALEAAIKADKAAVETAKLQLEYCTISSPIDGRTGSLKVHEGNVVKANETSFVTINQIAPIYVAFSVGEKHLTAIQRYMAAGPLQVQAFLPAGEEPPVEGRLTFVENEVDEATGTIRLKATFSNEDKRLWPGLFVNVSLTLSILSDAVVVPSQAVQVSQNGQYVFVLKSEDSTVELRPVVTGARVAGQTVVEKGLEAGEEVVTDGHMRLVPGARVDVKSTEEAGQAHS